MVSLAPRRSLGSIRSQSVSRADRGQLRIVWSSYNHHVEPGFHIVVPLWSTFRTEGSPSPTFHTVAPFVRQPRPGEIRWPPVGPRRSTGQPSCSASSCCPTSRRPTPTWSPHRSGQVDRLAAAPGAGAAPAAVPRRRAAATRPGPLFALYATRHEPVDELTQLARPTLEAISQVTGETVNLASSGATRSSRSRRSTPRSCSERRTGSASTCPPHCSALGKVFYADGALPVPRTTLERRTATPSPTPPC